MKTLRNIFYFVTVSMLALLASCSKESVSPNNGGSNSNGNGNGNSTTPDTIWRIKNIYSHSYDSIKSITYDDNGFITDIKYSSMPINIEYQLENTFSKSGDSILFTFNNNITGSLKLNIDSTISSIGGIPSNMSYLTISYTTDRLVNSISTNDFGTFNFHYNNGILDSATIDPVSFFTVSNNTAWVTKSSKTSVNPLQTIPFEIWNMLYQWNVVNYSIIYLLSSPNEIDSFISYNNYNDGTTNPLNEILNINYTFDTHQNLTDLSVGYGKSIHITWEIDKIK